MLGDANDTTKAFFGVRRKARFNCLIVYLLPEVVTKKNANVHGVTPRRAVRGTFLMLLLHVWLSTKATYMRASNQTEEGALVQSRMTLVICLSCWILRSA